MKSWHSVIGVCAGLVATGSPARAADLATGLVAYWRLDEPSIGAATMAVDSSPTGASGVYVGSPAPSGAVPTVGYADARSVLFSRAMTQAVHVTPVPAALKPAAVTLAAWFRLSTALPPTGVAGQADVVSVGDQIILRIFATQVGTAKRIANDWVSFNVNAAQDVGVWHHLAATVDGAGLAVYLDGASLGTLPDARPITYDLTANDLWIGRFGGGTGRDFDGEIDEVAMWARALTAVEIAALAAGAQPGTGAAAPPPDAGAAADGRDGAPGSGERAAADADTGPGDAGGGTGGSDSAAPAQPDGSPAADRPGDAGAGTVTDADARGSPFRADGSRPPPPSGGGCAVSDGIRPGGAAALLLPALVLAGAIVRRARRRALATRRRDPSGSGGA